MNKLLVVVSYKWWFLQKHYKWSTYLTNYICILVIKFNYLGCGVGGVLINNRGTSECGLCPWSFSGKVGAYAGRLSTCIIEPSEPVAST